jgi:hypothetical protein
MNFMPSLVASEYILLCLQNHWYDTAMQFLQKNIRLNRDTAKVLTLGTFLLNDKCDEAMKYISDYSPENNTSFARLSALAVIYSHAHRKSPLLAMTMSAVIPGLGKVYSRNWRDGFISFLFVATHSWQAYRGFSKNGTESAYGWVFGTLAAGFYAANLYGSWKAAKKYNVRLREKYHAEAEEILFGEH